MEVYRGLSEYLPAKNAVVTTGTFDGVHVGHKTIINNLKKVAADFDGETVLVTFHPHPRLVLEKDCGLKLLSTIDERIELLEKEGVDHLIIIPFDKDFSRMSSMEFVREILVKQIGTKKLVIGYDHHFGRNREGSFSHLLEFGPLYGFEVEEIPAFDVNHVNVSSTKIREALDSGDIITATKFLGQPYKLSGEVVRGEQLGRSIGYPTANIKVKEAYKLIPQQGVYVVGVTIGKEHLFGMLNVGVRPTVSAEKEVSIEVNIFDFDQDIYGSQIKIDFIKHIRNEIQFDSVNELKLQLEQDLFLCKKILSKV